MTVLDLAFAVLTEWDVYLSTALTLMSSRASWCVSCVAVSFRSSSAQICASLVGAHTQITMVKCPGGGDCVVCGCAHDQSSAWRRPADNKAVLAKMEGRKWNARTGHLCNRC